MEFQIENGVLIKYCGDDADILIPDNVTRIGEKAFEGSSIVSVEIPGNVISIAREAFIGCTELQKITLSGNTSTIGALTFQNCTALNKVYFTGDLSTFLSFDRHIDACHMGKKNVWEDTPLKYGASLYIQGQKLRDVIIAKGIGKIQEKIFWGCVSLRSVILPEDVKNIGERAFSGCRNLSSIHFSSGLLEIERDAFINCKKLTEIALPDTLEKIEARAFSRSGIKSVTIPGSVQSIGEDCFSECPNLKSVVICDGVKNIDEYAFGKCTKLTELTLSNSLTRIRRSVFRKCKELKELVIPDSVTAIEEYAFTGCESLALISVRGTIEAIDKESFPERITATFIVRGKMGNALKEFFAKKPQLWKDAVFPDLLCSEVPVSARKYMAFKTAEKIIKGETIREDIYKSYVKYFLDHVKDWLSMMNRETKNVIRVLINLTSRV